MKCNKKLFSLFKGASVLSYIYQILDCFQNNCYLLNESLSYDATPFFEKKHNWFIDKNDNRKVNPSEDKLKAQCLKCSGEMRRCIF